MQLKQAADPCSTCAIAGKADFQRFGVNVDGADAVVALAGNPNTGKTTVFNALTGLRMHVGNWPGKTVVQATGGFRVRGRKFKLVDLPGAYSLLSHSPDEEVARDFVLFGKPDCVVVVCDATALERNLNLVLQVLEITGRVVVALNLMDEAEKRGITVDDRSLARDLGVPVVPISARSGVGIPALLEVIDAVTKGELGRETARNVDYGKDVESALKPLVGEIERAFPGIPNARWVALRLLEGDQGVEDEIRRGTLGQLEHAFGSPA